MRAARRGVLKRLPVVVTGSLLLCLAACQTRTLDPAAQDRGADYFPLEVGRWYEYEVDSVGYGVFGKDSSRYQLREEVTQTFTDLTGATAFRVERFRRRTGQPWPATPDSVWVAQRDDRKALRTEDNTAFVRMIFPVQDRAAWDVNAFNVQPARTALLWGVGQPLTVGDSLYPLTARVVYEGRLEGGRVVELDTNLLGRRYEVWTYARGVGLVLVASENLVYQVDPNTSLPTVPRAIGEGLRYRQTLTAHGQD